MDQKELKIITAFKNGDGRALGYIFDLHSNALIYFAEKLLGIREEAENIAGNSFMKLWAKHADFDSLQAVKSFLYETTRESCLNFLKYSRKVPDLKMFFAPGSERNN